MARPPSLVSLLSAHPGPTCCCPSQKAPGELLGETRVHTSQAAAALSQLVQNCPGMVFIQSFFLFLFVFFFSDPDDRPIKRKFYHMMLFLFFNDQIVPASSQKIPTSQKAFKTLSLSDIFHFAKTTAFSQTDFYLFSGV